MSVARRQRVTTVGRRRSDQASIDSPPTGISMPKMNAR